MKKIAVLGTGIMGAGIASNFLKSGYSVIIWNRSKDKLKPLTKRGALTASSPKDATEYADIIFEVTADDKSSRLVWLGKDGILEGADKNKILITCATLSPKWIEELIAETTKRGFAFFDMPMTGSRVGAETGNLTLMVGGDAKKLKKLEKDLKAISAKILYFGKAGMGMRFKLLLNMMQAIHMVALGEGLKLAREAGLDVKKVGDAFVEKPGGAVIKIGWEGFQKNINPPNFSIEWMTKDLRYAKQLAKQTETPLLNDTLKKFEKLVTKLGFKDWSVIAKG